MRIIFITLISFIITEAFGQTTINNNCYTNTNPKTIITRNIYPFNKADRILIVKYKALAVQGKPNLFSWDTVQMTPKTTNQIDTSKFLAKKQLTKTGVDSLLKIINKRSKSNIAIEGIFVEPSNAILFLDKKGNIFEYIIICFSQIDTLRNYTEMTSSPAKVNLGFWCKDKGQMLTDFFINRGIDIVVTQWQ